ncbi:response regulator [bacterium]|nr:response regulator [bacterium]
MPVRKIAILLIEDSPTVRTLYKRTFEMKGFHVFEAGTGADGWKLAHQRVPDIIILDMMLPDCHGLSILKKIRGDDLTKHIPVLVLTSLKDIYDVQRAINLGANYYSVKGKDSPEKLLQMIYKLLKKTQFSQEMEQTSDMNESEETDSDQEDDASEIDDDIEFIRD